MHSGIIILSAYVAFAALGEVGAYFIGRQVEAYYPTWSLTVFLCLFLAVLVAAWPLASSVTPEETPRKPQG